MGQAAPSRPWSAHATRASSAHIGVTGHGLRIPDRHRRSLERFDFDSVLLPYNFPLLDQPDYRADVEALLQLCAERNVAVQTIKAVARRRWVGDDGPRSSWYEPLRDGAAVAARRPLRPRPPAAVPQLVE